MITAKQKEYYRFIFSDGTKTKPAKLFEYPHNEDYFSRTHRNPDDWLKEQVLLNRWSGVIDFEYCDGSPETYATSNNSNRLLRLKNIGVHTIEKHDLIKARLLEKIKTLTEKEANLMLNTFNKFFYSDKKLYPVLTRESEKNSKYGQLVICFSFGNNHIKGALHNKNWEWCSANFHSDLNFNSEDFFSALFLKLFSQWILQETREVA